MAALIFDLDGTLVDTLPDLTAALNAVLAELDRPPLDLGQVRGMVGDGARVLVGRALAATEVDEGEKQSTNHDLLDKMLERFLSIYGASPSEHSEAYPGVPEILHTLRQAGHRLGICTNKPEHPTIALLAALDLATHFDAVLGGDTLPVRKPDPEPVQATMHLLGGTPDSTVMIGDSANDLQAAHAAGIPVVLVRWGYSTVPVDTLGAGAVIDTFADLPAALDAVLGAKP